MSGSSAACARFLQLVDARGRDTGLVPGKLVLPSHSSADLLGQPTASLQRLGAAASVSQNHCTASYSARAGRVLAPSLEAASLEHATPLASPSSQESKRASY